MLKATSTGEPTRVHAVSHGEQAQQIAQHQAARVAHEYLPAPRGIAEHVVGKEGNQHTDADKGHQGVDPPVEIDEQSPEHGQGYHAQSGCQAVDAVYQVDGVGDEHYQYQRERHTEERGKPVDAEESVEIVDV